MVEQNENNTFFDSMPLKKNTRTNFTQAENGEVAMELFENMGWQMPVMNGNDAAAKIRDIENKRGTDQRTAIGAVTAAIMDLKIFGS